MARGPTAAVVSGAGDAPATSWSPPLPAVAVPRGRNGSSLGRSAHAALSWGHATRSHSARRPQGTGARRGAARGREDLTAAAPGPPAPPGAARRPARRGRPARAAPLPVAGAVSRPPRRAWPSQPAPGVRPAGTHVAGPGCVACPRPPTRPRAARRTRRGSAPRSPARRPGAVRPGPARLTASGHSPRFAPERDSRADRPRGAMSTTAFNGPAAELGQST